MRAIAGKQFRDWTGDAAVVGLWEVLRHYSFFRQQFRETIREISLAAPIAVILIDYPGFNLRLARALRKRLPSLKIIYYISPQIWAWNQRRLTQMKRYLDLMLCIFPFEPQIYKRAGLPAIFVGHPLSLELSAPEEPRDKTLVGIFPGSRRREIEKIFPAMRDAAIDLLRVHPQLRFEVAAASEGLAQLIRSALPPDGAKFSITTGEARRLMRRAAVGMIASGTATLEAAVSRLPFVLVYRVSWLTYLAARLVVRVRFLGMPNVLADREVVPEFIQHRARSGDVANAVARLLSQESDRARMLKDFDSIAGTLALGETSENAANAVLTALRKSPCDASQTTG